MNPLAIFHEKDVFPNKGTDVADVDFEDRRTGKAVVFDQEGNVALVGNKVNSFQLLPGGGIHENESVEEGIIRECLEEIGCVVELEQNLGIVEDFRTRDKKHCINYCYTANLVGEKGNPVLTEDETKNGMHVIWLPLNKAIEKLREETEQLKRGEVLFYNTGFNILRDFIYLEEAQKSQR